MNIFGYFVSIYKITQGNMPCVMKKTALKGGFLKLGSIINVGVTK